MRTLCFLCAGAITMGCGPGEDDDSAGDTGGSDSASTGADADTGSSSSASASVSATDSGSEGSTSTADTGTPTTDGGTLADTGTDESDTTAGVDPCVGLARKECMADATCAPIVCAPIEMSMNGGAQFCIGDDEFIGCQAADIACAEIRTYTCTDDSPIFACPNACIPADWMECPPPAIEIPPC